MGAGGAGLAGRPDPQGRTTGAWRRVAAGRGPARHHGDREVRRGARLPAGPLDGWPKDLVKLQVSGTDLDDPEPPVDADPTAPVLWLNPDLDMSAGKTMAQAGHAAQLAWWELSDEQRTAWRDAGFPSPSAPQTRPAGVDSPPPGCRWCATPGSRRSRRGRARWWPTIRRCAPDRSRPTPSDLRTRGGAMAGTRLDGRVERGNRTRQLVLRRTVDIASVEGLEALSVGRLATELQLSKSGVFALFGSKQELQLATVREAARIYVEQVIRPASGTPPVSSGPGGCANSGWTTPRAGSSPAAVSSTRSSPSSTPGRGPCTTPSRRPSGTGGPCGAHHHRGPGPG